MQRYEERLAAYRAVDFDDLIVLPARLLGDDAEVRDAWRARLRYVLVDEYQDTNGVQYELMKLIAGERGLFTAVGDDDQSIYGWRGATVENLKRLPADYPALQGDRARAELPLDRQHPRRRERGDRPQPEALREEALERARRRRRGRRRRVRRRSARGRARAGAHRVAARRRRGVGRHRDPLSRQPPGARLRAGAAQGGRSVQGLGRAELLRPRRDPRPLRVAAADRQPRRRPGVPARRDEPEARHRPPDARRARRVRRPMEVEPVRGALRRDARRRAAAARDRRAARVRARRQRAAGARARDDRQRRGARAPARVAEGHRLRGAPARRRGVARARDRALDQRARLRRLDRASLRRKRLGGDRRRRSRRRAFSRSRRRSRSSSAWPSAATTRTSSRCRRCTPPRGSNGRT